MYYKTVNSAILCFIQPMFALKVKHFLLICVLCMFEAIFSWFALHILLCSVLLAANWMNCQLHCFNTSHLSYTHCSCVSFLYNNPPNSYTTIEVCCYVKWLQPYMSHSPGHSFSSKGSMPERKVSYFSRLVN